MTPRRTLLVGSGRIGTRVASALSANGGEVVTLRRSPAADAAGPHIQADVARPLEVSLPDVDAVVFTLPPGENASLLPDAVANIARALPATPRRCVFVSSTRVLEGYTDDRPLTEQDAARPRGERAQQLVDGEARATELFDATILRPAGIYGPGRDRLIRQVLAGTPVDHDRRTNRIHETDVVRAIVAVVTADDPPRLIHATDTQPATLGEVVSFLAERLGVPVPPRGERGERAGTVLVGDRLHALLGTLTYPTFRDGYGEIVAAMR